MARKAMLEECYKVRNEIRKSVSSEIYDAYIRYLKNVVERAENGQNNNFAYWVEIVFYEYNYTKSQNCVY